MTSCAWCNRDKMVGKIFCSDLTVQHANLPKMEAFFMPCSKTCLIVGARVPRTRCAMFSFIESSPALLYCLERSSSNCTNFAGNQPRSPFNSPIQQSSSLWNNKTLFTLFNRKIASKLDFFGYTFWLITVITSFLRNPSSSSSCRSKSSKALALLFLLRITPA